MKKYEAPKCIVICLCEELNLLNGSGDDNDNWTEIDTGGGNDGDADSNYRTSLWSDFE